MAFSSPQRVAVIGLGRFGTSLARSLAFHGAEVIAIDRNKELIDDIADDVAIAVQLDSTDEAALRSEEVDRVDCAVVSIGENFEAALLTTVICHRNLEVPQVICRAQTKFHAEIFAQIGATEVIQPEQHAGEMLGRRLAHPGINDYIQLADGFTILEMAAPERFVGRTVRDISLRAEYKVNLIAIRRSSTESPDSQINVPGPDDVIHAEDLLLLAGDEDSLAGISDA